MCRLTDTNRRVPGSSLIGFLMLIGIVVTNAIVLLDLVERLRAEGHRPGLIGRFLRWLLRR